MNMKRILIVEDDSAFMVMLEAWLRKKGFDTETSMTVAEAKAKLRNSEFSIVLTDMRLPDEDGISLLEWINGNVPETPVIIMTGYADIQNAVKCMKMGASDYITKPVDPESLLEKIMETGKEKPGKPERKQRTEPSEPGNTDYIEGRSKASERLYKMIRLVSPTNISVLIRGASGTGKEHVAKLIHRESSRKDKPFVAVDCGAIPKDLAGSGFFGHKKGSFTGAINDKKGAFLEADGGTLFLDEVGNLSYDVQVQLLRAIQERKIKPIGTNTEIDVDIRLIAATNENLEDAIRKGDFREDLYHRLNGFTLDVPELKDQKEDIMSYARFFLKKANRELGKEVKDFDTAAEQAIIGYGWPGNIRELQNTVLRSTLLASGDYIGMEELPDEITGHSGEQGNQAKIGIQVRHENDEETYRLKNRDEEKNAIARALESAEGNKSKAAKLLGIDRKTLYNKLKLYDME